MIATLTLESTNSACSDTTDISLTVLQLQFFMNCFPGVQVSAVHVQCPVILPQIVVLPVCEILFPLTI